MENLTLNCVFSILQKWNLFGSSTKGFMCGSNFGAIGPPSWRRTNLGTRDSCRLKNYRPVSNLPFLCKLLEKVVQLQYHITSNDAMPKFQSPYRQFNSTETALIKIFNDLLLAADQGQVSALCLLDLMSAFDTVDDHAVASDTPATEFRCWRRLSGVV